MSDKSGIEWTEATWNPLVGCTSVSPGCDNCLAPETLVLYADMSWRPLSSTVVGDQLLGFTETPTLGANRKIEVTTVQEVWQVEAPTVVIETDGARVVASASHRWLVDRARAWQETRHLRLDSPLRALGSPSRATTAAFPADDVTSTTDYQHGYIAGAHAGDGTFRLDESGQVQSYWRVAVLESDRAILDRLQAYLATYGITVEVRRFDGGGAGVMLKVETRQRGHLRGINALIHQRDEYHPSRQWMAGWLAGFFDTDGSYDGNLRFSQRKDNGLLNRTVQYIEALGFACKAEQWETACPTVRLVGDATERVDFLSTILPSLTRKTTDMIGRLLETRTSPVTTLRRGPVRTLIDIQTSTGTFIAEGLCTHNCYARTQVDTRFHPAALAKGGKHLEAFPAPFETVSIRPDRFLTQPLHWGKPRRIFVNSLSDLFHKDVPDEFIAKVFAVMALAQRHTFQLLTKRHGRMRSLLSSAEFWASIGPHMSDLIGAATQIDRARSLPNVWLGVSVENQQWADVRIPALLDTPAAVRFLSCEPLLGPVDGTSYLSGNCPRCGDDITAAPCGDAHARMSLDESAAGIDWVIAGGESGPGARPMHPDWARSLRDQCIAAGVPFLFKQWGEWGPTRRLGAGTTDDPRDLCVPTVLNPKRRDYEHGEWLRRVGKKAAGRELDGRTWDEYPERQVPPAG